MPTSTPSTHHLIMQPVKFWYSSMRCHTPSARGLVEPTFSSRLMSGCPGGGSGPSNVTCVLYGGLVPSILRMAQFDIVPPVQVNRSLFTLLSCPCHGFEGFHQKPTYTSDDDGIPVYTSPGGYPEPVKPIGKKN